MEDKPNKKIEAVKPVCICCDKPGASSIIVAAGIHANGSIDRLYLPNQSVRAALESGMDGTMHELWLCRPCMRFVEDNFRASIAYLKSEHGLKYTEQDTSTIKLPA